MVHPNAVHFCPHQVQRAPDFKTSMSKPVPTNQISIWVGGRGPGGGKPGRLLRRGGVEKLYGWVILEREKAPFWL